MSDSERLYLYDGPSLGIKKSDGSSLVFHLMNYFIAATYAQDLNPRGRYLDFGCGSGYGTELVGSLFQASTGIDLNPEALSYAVQMHSRAGTVYKSGLEDSDTGFDFITLIESIEHLSAEEGEQMLDKLSLRLTDQGCLFVTTPIATTQYGLNPKNPYHKHEWQPGEIKGRLRPFFKDIKITQIGPARMVVIAGGKAC